MAERSLIQRGKGDRFSSLDVVFGLDQDGFSPWVVQLVARWPRG